MMERLQEHDFQHSQLWEMGNLRKFHSGLPVNVWIDEHNHYIQGKHWKRIKVQNDYSDKMHFSNTFSMTIEQEPRIIGQVDLKSADVQAVADFVSEHREILSAIGDEYDLIDLKERL